MIKELFKKQIEENAIVTEELLQKLNVKQYSNGDDIKVGDKILYALLLNKNPKEVMNSTDTTISLVTLIPLKEEHFDLYTYDERMVDKNNPIPSIFLKV